MTRLYGVQQAYFALRERDGDSSLGETSIDRMAQIAIDAAGHRARAQFDPVNQHH